MQASFDICTIARDLEHAEAMTAEQRSAWIMERYRNTLAQFAFASFATFSEALNQELASRLARTQRSTQKKATPPKPSRSCANNQIGTSSRCWQSSRARSFASCQRNGLRPPAKPGRATGSHLEPQTR